MAAPTFETKTASGLGEAGGCEIGGVTNFGNRGVIRLPTGVVCNLKVKGPTSEWNMGVRFLPGNHECNSGLSCYIYDGDTYFCIRSAWGDIE